MILNDIYDFLGRFIVYPSDEARVVHALWIAHTHLMDEWYISPRLLFLSPTRGTGKTTALQMTNLLVPCGVLTANATAAYIFRRIGDQSKPLPSLQYDEIDTVFSIRSKKDTEELRAILNAGYKKGATVGRCVGDNFNTQDFPVYCPVALAGIDQLSGFETVRSRSIVIEMQRRKPGEVVQRYRSRDVDPEGASLRERLSEWAKTVKGIGDDRPMIPNGISDRDEEIWEPLLAIADRAGGDWPDKARCSAVALVALTGKGTGGDLGERLLSDLRSIFEGRDRYHTNSIISILINKEESPWSVIDNGKPINARLLAEMLRPYKVTPKDIRIGGIVLKGYEADDFTDAWERYLPSRQEGHLPQEALQALQGQQGQQSPPDTPEALSTAATGATAATPATKPSFDEWMRMSEDEKKAIEAPIRETAGKGASQRHPDPIVDMQRLIIPF
jgi:uncharacterized protein DUF3631